MATTVMVTGATGLLGSWITRIWPRGDVHVQLVTTRQTDLLEPGAAARLVESSSPDQVVHLAWCASGSPGYRHSPDNERWLRASLELHDACRERGVGFWATGSIIDRDELATDPYTRAKVRLRAALASEINASAIGWFRPAYVFDPDRGRPDLVRRASEAVRTGVPATLRTPAAAHDFVHASDVADAIVAAVEHGLRGVISIGSGRLRRVSDVFAALGAPWVPAETDPAAVPVVSHADHLDDTAPIRSLGWTPATTDRLLGP